MSSTTLPSISRRCSAASSTNTHVGAASNAQSTPVIGAVVPGGAPDIATAGSVLSTSSRHPSIHADWSVLNNKAPPAAAAAVANSSVAQRALPTQSKLFSEVERLVARGQALLRRDGCEADGIALLGKALWARSRFPVLQKEGDGRAPWEHGELFVVTCNQTAARLVQTLQASAPSTANRIMACAETALTDEENDPFAAFYPLRQYLLGASLNTIAALQKLNNEPPESIVKTLERALRHEGGHFATLTLYNLGAAYVQARQYDAACAAVTQCIALADHYLSLPASDTPSEAFGAFLEEVATHATLGHLLVSTISLWTGMMAMALRHTKLALSCALTHLGEKCALTTRCADRLDRVKALVKANAVPKTADDVPPSLPLQAACLASARFPPSHLLPFALVLPLPQSVAEYVEQLQRRPEVGAPAELFPRLTVANGPERPLTSSGDDRSSAMQQQQWQRLTSPSMALSGSYGSTTGAPSRETPPPRAAPVNAPTERLLPHLHGGDKKARSAVAGPRSSTPRARVASSSAATNDKQSATPTANKHGVPPMPPLVARSAFAGPAPAARRDGDGSSASSSNVIDLGASASLGSGRGQSSQQQLAPSVSTTDFRPKPPSRSGVRGSGRGTSLAASASSAVPDATTTVLPKAQLLAYQRIQREVHTMLQLDAQRPPQPLPLAEGHKQQHMHATHSSTTTRGPAFAWHRNVHAQQQHHREETGAMVAAAEVLRMSDAKLRELSILVPDHTDADEILWHHCATQIQKVFRAFVVRRGVVAPRRAALAYWLSVLPAGECMLAAWRNSVACRPAIAKKYEMRYQLKRSKAATVAQAFVRHCIAERELRNRWVQAAKAEVQKIRRQQLEAGAVVFIQAWLRGCHTRQRRSLERRNARLIQRTYRLYRLFCVVRLLVLRRRIHRREYAAMRFTMASRLQHWWRHNLPRRRAVQALERRRAALSAHMVDFLARDGAYWESVRHLDDDACRQMVQRWGMGFHVRRRMYVALQTRRRRLHAVRGLQRWFRFVHSRHSLLGRIHEHDRRMATRKRVQEVREAVLDMQRTVRGWFGRRRVRAIRGTNAQRDRAARTIQCLVRRVLRRGAFQRLRAASQQASNRYMVATARQCAAVQIQSTWRMCQTKRIVAAFRQFMQVDRHRYASKIQRQVRLVQATRTAESKRTSKAQSLVGVFVAEAQHAAARRIQSAVRMMIARNRLREREASLRTAARTAGLTVARPRRLLFPTKLQRRCAALVVQRQWRRFAAIMYCMQLRQARCWVDSSRIHQEHLQMYAVVMQCAVRRYLLTPLRMAAARERCRARAAARIQRVVKAFLDRKKALLLLLQQEEDDVLQMVREEHSFAAIRIQKHVKGFITKAKFDGFKQSVVRAQAIVRGYLARRQRAQRHGERDAAASQVLQTEMCDAAVVIQRAWRQAGESPQR